MQVSISSKTIPPPSTRLEGSKNPPLGTIIVYKNPSLGTKHRVKSPTQGHKVRKFHKCILIIIFREYNQQIKIRSVRVVLSSIWCPENAKFLRFLRAWSSGPVWGLTVPPDPQHGLKRPMVIAYRAYGTIIIPSRTDSTWNVKTFKKFTWIVKDLIYFSCFMTPPPPLTTLPTVIFITSYHVFIWHLIGDVDLCTWQEFSSPIRCQMKTRHRVFHWISNSNTWPKARVLPSKLDWFTSTMKAFGEIKWALKDFQCAFESYIKVCNCSSLAIYWRFYRRRKGPVKLIKWVKIAHSFLQSVSDQLQTAVKEFFETHF